jgi:hypothetical protein
MLGPSDYLHDPQQPIKDLAFSRVFRKDQFLIQMVKSRLLITGTSPTDGKRKKRPINVLT